MWWHFPTCILGFLHVFFSSRIICYFFYLVPLRWVVIRISWPRFLLLLLDCYSFGTWDYLLSMMGVGHLGSMRLGSSVSYTIEIWQLDAIVGCTCAVVPFFWSCDSILWSYSKFLNFDNLRSHEMFYLILTNIILSFHTLWLVQRI